MRSHTDAYANSNPYPVISKIYLGLAYKYYNKLTTLITSADIYIFESHEDLVKNQDLLQYLEE